MSLQIRTTTLTAAETEGGIRIYTKDSDGYARELCHNTTASQLSAAFKANNKDAISQRKDWHAGAASFQCGVDSALCSFAWATWTQSIFFQDTKGTIREQRHSGKWADTGFVQENAMSGTNIAAVYSPGAARIVLFFQDKEGMIHYRAAEGFKWSNSVPLVKAAPGTGIGATAWNNLDEIRVYYQDEKNFVREYSGSFGGKWSQTTFEQKYEVPVGDITAVSWRNGQATEIRLYLQNESNTIIELCNDGQVWSRGQFEAKALPNADIIAFTRPFDNGARCTLHVIWAGQDQQLWQRVIVPGQGWLEPTVIASIRNAGDYAGGWIGDQFSDISAGIESKKIVKVRVRCGDIIDGVQTEFDDGSSTPLRGGKGGGEQVFILNPGEDIIRVTCVSDREWIHRLQFDTSDKRQSPWYGLETLDKRSAWYSESYVTHVWYNDGRALAGFLGCSEKYMKGIKPIWSDRYSKASFKTVDDYVREAERLNGELGAIKGRLGATQRRAASYKTSLEGLRTLGAEAVGGLVALAEEVEYMHDLAVASTRAKLGAKERRAKDVERQAAVCKEDSDVLEAGFKKLGEALARVKPVGDEIHADIAHILAEAKAKDAVIKTFASRSEAYVQDVVQGKNRVTQQRDLRKRQLETAELNLKEKQKVLDEISASGLNTPSVSPFEDSLADTASAFFETASEELKQAKIDRENKAKSLVVFEADLANIAARTTKINAVLARIVEFTKEVQAEANAINALVGESAALQGMAGKYQALLAHLYDGARPLDANTQARGFAAGLLPIVRLALEAPYLKELLKVDPAVLEGTMKEIAECKDH